MRRLDRVTPEGAVEAIGYGALLVDARVRSSSVQRESDFPGALLIERNVLEWRLDPRRAGTVPQATDHDVVVILVCSEGYSSSLAAASLQDLGLRNATDLIGGFHAWRDAGLPVTATSLVTSRTIGEERGRRGGRRACRRCTATTVRFTHGSHRHDNHADNAGFSPRPVAAATTHQRRRARAGARPRDAR